MKKGKIKIAILMGGPSPEHNVSLNSGSQVFLNLDKNKYSPVPIIITKKLEWLIPKKSTNLDVRDIKRKNKDKFIKLTTGQALDWLIKNKIDVSFIALHGEYGEDGTIQGILEATGICYTGSKLLTSSLAMDKIKSAEIFSYHQFKIPKFISLSKEEWQKNKAKIKKQVRSILGFPCIIKPNNLGSSVGMSIAKNRSHLEKSIGESFSFSNLLMIQKYIKGIEVSCGVLEDNKDITALPPTLIIPKKSNFFDYKSKYIKDGAQEITPAPLPKNTIKKIRHLSIQAHKILSCSGFSRTDMIIADKNIYILETNTIPGLTLTSLFPQQARVAGLSFSVLLDKIISSALK